MLCAWQVLVGDTPPLVPGGNERWSRGERVGCGCFLVVVGFIAAVAGWIWWAMDDFYGQTPLWMKAVAVAGLATAALGILMITWPND